MKPSLEDAMYTDRLRLDLSVRWFARWATDETAALLAAAAKTPPVKTLEVLGAGRSYVQTLQREARRFAKGVRRIRKSPDRLRLLEARAAETLMRFRAAAFGAEDPHLLTWVSGIVEAHVQARWSSLLPGDHVEEISVDSGTGSLRVRSGILSSRKAGDPAPAVTVDWVDGSKETLVATSGRVLLRRFEDHDEVLPVQAGRAAGRRGKAVRRLRGALVADVLGRNERILAHAAAGTTVRSLLDPTVERAQPVVLYATTERVMWVGIDGSEHYRPVPLGDDGHVRWIDYGGFLDFVGGSSEEGPRGPLPSSGFGFLALSADQAAALRPGVAEGLASAAELRIWAMQVTGSEFESAWAADLARVIPGAEFFQLFHFLVWGPSAEQLIREASRRTGAARE